MISVLIATHNRSRLLAQTLKAICAQDPAGEPVEIVVIDNGSTDGTAAVVETAARIAPVPVTYIWEPEPGKSAALNRGISAASGGLLVFTDDDVQPEPGWLAAFAEGCRRAAADFAVGRILPLWEVPPPDWLSPELYGVLAVPDHGPARQEVAAGVNEHLMALGANMAVRRAVFDRLGGWRTDLGKLRGTLRTGEDGEFFLRMLRAGLHGVYVPEARVRHFVPAARLERQYFRRWFLDNGGIAAQLEREYPSSVIRWFGVPRYRYREASLRLLGLAQASLRADRRARFTHGVWLLWMASYARVCWFGPRSGRGDNGRLAATRA